MIFFFIFILVSLLVAIIFTETQIEIKLVIKNGKNYSFIVVRLLKGLVNLRLNLSMESGKHTWLKVIIRKTDTSKDYEKTPKKIINKLVRKITFIKKYKKQINYMLSRINFDKLAINTSIGTSDAAVTAMVSGLTMAFMSVLLAYLNNKLYLKNQRILVTPFYQGPIFDLNLDCIIGLKLGHIIVTSIKIGLKKLRW